jgi:hypothetical protein
MQVLIISFSTFLCAGRSKQPPSTTVIVAGRPRVLGLEDLSASNTQARRRERREQQPDDDV